MLKLKKRSFGSGKSLKETINRALRRGLEASNKKNKKYICPEFSLGGTRHYDLDRALRLAESMEDDEIARKIRLKK